MKKRLILMTVALSALTFLLAACGSSDKSGATGKDKTTISYAIWDDSQLPGMKKIADAFMKENPEIQVKVEATPWDQYWTKLEAGATGSNMPDVFWMHGNETLRYAENGILLELPDSLDLKPFPEELVNMYSFDDKHYGVPKDISSIGLFYNKEIFDKAGEPYPDESWDWAKLKEVAKKLTDKDTGVYGFGAPNSNEAGYYSFVFSNKGEILSEDKKSTEITMPETQEALQWWIDFSLEDGSSPTTADFSENGMENYFISGRLAMATFGSWQIASFAENDYVLKNADVTVLPKGKERITVYNGLANVAAATTKHKKEVEAFLTFLGSKEASEIQSDSGVAISAYEGTQQGWVDYTKKDFNTQAYVDMLENKVLRPGGGNFAVAESYQTEQLAKAFEKKNSVKEITDEMAPKLNKLLRE